MLDGSYSDELIMHLIAYVEKKHKVESDEVDELKCILGKVKYIKSPKLKFITRLALVIYLASKREQDWHFYSRIGVPQ